MGAAVAVSFMMETLEGLAAKGLEWSLIPVCSMTFLGVGDSEEGLEGASGDLMMVSGEDGDDHRREGKRCVSRIRFVRTIGALWCVSASK